jgi:hypothetical protein
MGNDKTGACLCWHKQLDNLPDFGPGLALWQRSARLLQLPCSRPLTRACSYRRKILHGGCNAKLELQFGLN